MNQFVKYLLWGAVIFILVTHPTIISYVLHQISVFAASMKQGGY